MKLMDDFRERADRLREDLNLHGESISAAVRTNTTAIAIVAGVSIVALMIGIAALKKAGR